MVVSWAIQFWDIKPDRQNWNQLFNTLCNVVPVDHPWSWQWYRAGLDIKEWEKQQYRLEKCKWLKQCRLYEYDCNNLVEENPKSRKNKPREWSSFTDTVTFDWYRLYLRKSDSIFEPYESDNWPDTCDEWSRPSNLIEHNSRWSKLRVYVQIVNTDGCAWVVTSWADDSPIVLVKEYKSSPCSYDRFIMGYGGVWTPKVIWWKSKISIMFYKGQMFAYLSWDKSYSLSLTDHIFFEDLGIYVSWLSAPDDTTKEIVSHFWLPENGCFIPNTSELTKVVKIPDQVSKIEITELNSPLKIYRDFWEVPYIVADNQLISINWFYTLADWKCKSDNDIDLESNKFEFWWDACRSRDVKEGKKRMFIQDNALIASKSRYEITWAARRWARLVFISWGRLFVSGNWSMQWVFWSDLWTWGDVVRWSRSLPSGITDVRSYNTSLLLFGPKGIYWLNSEDALKTWRFSYASDNDEGYFNPSSYANDDWEFLIIRKWGLLETMVYNWYYNTFDFKPDTWFFVNSHIKTLNPSYDSANIDTDIHKRYVSIYNKDGKYSKLLVYDKHYNLWYHWIITWARVTRVKDWIYLWDNIYVNKWRTRGRKDDDTKWDEIIQIISTYIWEEWLQTPKHIAYVKTAIWRNSNITNDSKWRYTLSYWGRKFERRNPITATKYPSLLTLKEKDWVIMNSDFGEKILWKNKKEPHSLSSEIKNYLEYSKFDTTILRAMWEDIDNETLVADFASIKEWVNAPANVLEITMSARHFDNIQFWSRYIWYYTLNPAFEDIENTNIDISWMSDQTRTEHVEIHTGETPQEILNPYMK